METKVNFSNLLIFIIFIVLTLPSNAQCDNTLIDRGKEKLQAKYLKDFKVRLQKGKKGKVPPSMTFSMYMNSGNLYRIVVENSTENESFGILSFYDDVKMYGTTYNKELDAVQNIIEFYCTRTQVYYLNIYFKDGKEGCAAILVGIADPVEE